MTIMTSCLSSGIYTAHVTHVTLIPRSPCKVETLITLTYDNYAVSCKPNACHALFSVQLNTVS